MEIDVGSWGWKHAGWEHDVFYPDDLPEDWRLAYYSNEFDTVVIPAAYWEQVNEEDWLDDVDENFIFHIDWPLVATANEREKCREFIDRAGAQIGLLLVNNQLASAADSQSVKMLDELSAILEVRQYGGADSELDYLTAIQDENSQSNFSGERLLLLHSSEEESLRELTSRLKNLLQSENIQQIILTGKEPSINRLKELQTLLQLF